MSGISHVKRNIIRIMSSDIFADKAGARIAEHLDLKPHPKHPDRWQTADGMKSNEGLARSIVRVIEETK